ncbi:MAG TPA: ABC transporter substrate-binding protein [Patescibacteria group bacterium]|nr:ABC transporter substrate-binding protein [Patescibacteria group bacterium]
MFRVLVERFIEKRKIFITLFVVVALLGIILYQRNKTSSNGNSILIGSVLPLTGEQAVYGEGIKNAINLAIDQSGTDVKVIFEDDHGCVAADAVSAAQKLVSIDKVKNIVGAFCSGATLGILPVSEAGKVILISPSATSKNLTGKGHYFFRTIASDAEQSKAIAKYAFDKGYKKGAMLFDSSQDAAVSQKDDVKKTFVSLGGQVVVEESYIKGNDKDFRSQLTKIWSAKPGAIFVGATPEALALILKQARSLGITSVFVATDTSEGTRQVVDLAGKLSDGLIFPFSPTPSGKQYTDFVSSYKSRYGKEPSAYSAEGYDAMTLLLKAVLASNGGTSDDVKSQLLKIGQNYAGASGVISFNSNGDVQKPEVIMMFKDGKPVKAE